MLESVGEKPMASPTPAEEALLVSEDAEPQGSQVSTQHIPIQPEEDLDDAVELGVLTTDLLDTK